MKLHFYLIFSVLILIVSCSDRNNRNRNTTNSENSNQSEKLKTPKNGNPINSKEEEKVLRKVGKAVYYLENSGSMFGFVSGYTEYVNVVSGLAYKSRFSEENTPRKFYFVNGGEDLKVNFIGDKPSILNDKLNINGFRRGDITRSNLNSMFQIALNKAKKDTISFLISDGIYAIGKPQSPMNALSTEGNETKDKFIKRLSEGDLQTIIIKLKSYFKGSYYTVEGKIKKLAQIRPYYIWVFGETELLNEYFSDEYIKKLEGFSDVARFLKLSELDVKYQATAHNKVGSFRFGKKDKNKLIDVESDRNGQGFYFTFAVDYSSLPFSDSYLKSIKNYACNNSNFSIESVTSIDDVKLYGLNFTPTHLIKVGTKRNPTCQLEISLKNNIPNWIEKTNIDNDRNIVGDSLHTFGFRFLTKAINEAYQYKNQESNISTFKFVLKK